MSIHIRVTRWLCPRCGWALNRRFSFRPISKAAITCPGCGGSIVASEQAVIHSWRMASQLYGVLATWAALIVLSYFFPWGRSPESALLTAILVGWLPGAFPGMLFTTFLGEAIGKLVAASLGLRERGLVAHREPRPGFGRGSSVPSAPVDTCPPEQQCYFCGKPLGPNELQAKVCPGCRS
jgi:hypothetical protein